MGIRHGANPEGTQVIAFHRTDAFLSNFFPATFIIDDIYYTSVEQYYQCIKCISFQQTSNQRKIMRTTSPVLARYFGSCFPRCENDIWFKLRKDVMFTGCWAKFNQNYELKQKLLQTGDSILVESAKNDLYWGSGVDLYAEDVFNTKSFPGQNTLGRILANVRTIIGYNQKAQYCIA